MFVFPCRIAVYFSLASVSEMESLNGTGIGVGIGIMVGINLLVGGILLTYWLVRKGRVLLIYLCSINACGNLN